MELDSVVFLLSLIYISVSYGLQFVKLLNESFLSYAGGLVLQCSFLGYGAGVPNIDYDVSFLQMLKIIVLFIFAFLWGNVKYSSNHIY